MCLFSWVRSHISLVDPRINGVKRCIAGRYFYYRIVKSNMEQSSTMEAHGVNIFYVANMKFNSKQIINISVYTWQFLFISGIMEVDSSHKLQIHI